MRELKEIRKEITEIDNKMAELFCQRMELVKQVAEYKKVCGMPIYDPEREAHVLENGAQRVSDPDMRSYYVNYLQAVMDISKKYQADMLEGQKIAYCGTKGAFAWIAAKHLFPTSQLVAFSSFKKAYDAVCDGRCECAVLPVENSFAGDVGQVNDLMFSGPLHVNGMYDLAVNQDLLGIPGAAVSDIETVVSHPQALSQCATFIKENSLSEKEYSNTALAAEFVRGQSDKSLAAIGSAESAEIFGLEVIARSINDDRSNTTRFAVFSRVERHFAKDGGKPYFSLLFTARDEAGSLAEALTILGRHGFNMRTLRSRPMKDLLWSYYFYVEAEGDIFDENGQACIAEMKSCCDKIKVVGAYNNLQKQKI